MNLYNQPYFNRRNWILENLKDLDITSEEFTIIMMIDYMNEFGKSINIPTLASNCKLEPDDVDSIVSDLINKGFLKMVPVNRRMTYSLEGLFVIDEEGNPYDKNSYQSLFQLFEQEFGRPLTQKESEMLSEWIEQYDLKLIEYALREAITFEGMSFHYVDRILLNWKEKNYTVKMYEEGKNI